MLLYNLESGTMFKNPFKKKKPRVYLGSTVVVTRTEFFKSDQEGLFKSFDLESELRGKLREALSLPLVEARIEPQKTDLALEIVIVGYRGGEFDFELPLLMWRPKIEVKARLYCIETGKTTKSVIAKEKVSWKQFFGKIISLNGIFRYKPLFGVQEMEILLYQCCIKALKKLTK